MPTREDGSWDMGGHSEMHNQAEWDEMQKLNSDYKGGRNSGGGGNGCMIALLCIATTGLSAAYGLYHLMC